MECHEILSGLVNSLKNVKSQNDFMQKRDIYVILIIVKIKYLILSKLMLFDGGSR